MELEHHPWRLAPRAFAFVLLASCGSDINPGEGGGGSGSTGATTTSTTGSTTASQSSASSASSSVSSSLSSSTSSAGGGGAGGEGGGPLTGPCAVECQDPNAPRSEHCYDCGMGAALGGECASDGTECLIAAQQDGDTDNCCPCGSYFVGDCVDDGFVDTLCESHGRIEQALAACICEACTEEGGGGSGQGGAGQGGAGQGGGGQGGSGQGGSGQGGAGATPCADACPGGLIPIEDLTPDCSDCFLSAVLGGDCASRGSECLAASEEPGDANDCCPCGSFLQGNCAEDGFLPEVCASHAALVEDLASCGCATCG